MTNILLSSNDPTLATDEARRQQGMVNAGEFIDGWVFNPMPPAKDFFDDLWNGLEGNDVDEHMFMIEDGGALQQLFHNNQTDKYFFFDGAGDKNNFDPKPEDDKKVGKNQKMTIAIPERNQHLVAGYVGEIVDDMIAIMGCAPDAGAIERAKKYLLAVIFLNRCQ